MMSLIRIVLTITVLAAAGCATEQPAAKNPDAAHPRARELDLVAPDPTEDLTKLDDATLAQRIKAGQKQVDTLLAKSIEYLSAFDGDDISRDAGYRAILREQKLAETELGRLEMEHDRRLRIRRR